MKNYRSYSSQETRLLGDKIAKQVLGFSAGGGSSSGGRFPAFAKALAGKQVLGKKKGAVVPRRARDKCALILALKGDLGAGKTTFVQGFLRGLGVRGRVNSPTFVLMKRFKLRDSRFTNAYHIDCYRVKKSAELSSLGLKEIFSDPKNIVLVEWPERIKNILPKSSINLVFNHGKDIKSRGIKVL
ncbi:MAG: tRNA (adenosine(37)-N6)-threonylcarbamoyltransferase complex ATPase subunit type 1 TsaE [Patescibacteria group bacterium]